MTRHTGNLRVLARKSNKLLTDGSVTVEACVYKRGSYSDLSWRVRIGMAYDAISDFRPMDRFVAGGALGHYRIPVSFTRVIGMKKIVAVLAGEAVPPAANLEVLELTCVALGTLTCR